MSLESSMISTRRAWSLSQWNNKQLGETFFYLRQYLNADYDLSKSLLEISCLEIDPRLRLIYRVLSKKVAHGMLLSEAMESFRAVFDSTLIAFIQAGECRGDLAVACGHCEETLKWREDFKQKLRNTLTYPGISLLSITFVFVFLVIVVVPGFESFLTNQGMSKTWHTELLLSASNVVIGVSERLPVFALILIALLLPIKLGMLGVRQPITRSFYLPVVTDIKISLALSRYCYHTGSLIQAGIVLPESMSIAERVVSQRSTRLNLAKLRENLQAGIQLDKSKTLSVDLPDTFKRLWQVAEKSDDISQTLVFSSQILAQQGLGRIERSMALVTPVVFMLLGLTLFWIVASLILPVYQVAIELVVMKW